MSRLPGRRVVSLAVLVGVTYVLSGLPALAAGPAAFTGRVLGLNGVTPRSGATVTLVDEGSGRTFESAPTDDRGRFMVSGAPAGTYALLVETSEGAFLASSALSLQPGDNPPASLTLTKNAGAPKAPKKKATKTAGPRGGRKGLPLWSKIVIVGGIAIIGGVAINEVTKTEEPASPF